MRIYIYIYMCVCVYIYTWDLNGKLIKVTKDFPLPFVPDKPYTVFDVTSRPRQEGRTFPRSTPNLKKLSEILGNLWGMGIGLNWLKKTSQYSLSFWHMSA